jgi:hypothetical protein
MPIHRGIKQCSYVRPDGRRCGSPACNIDGRCYHHDLERYPEPLEVTPQLREIADVLSDPLFEQWITEIADRHAVNQDVTEELFSALTLFLGYDLRERNTLKNPSASSVSSAVKQENLQRRATAANL